MSNDYDWGTWIGQVQFSGTPPPPAPAVPVATAATSVTSSGFTANWGSSSGATGYRLDVSTTSAFSSFVSGYQDLDVGNVVTQAVTGLNASTAYFYRVRAYNTGGTSGSSNVISVTTSAPATPAAPAATAATGITTSGFTANWAVSSGATGYRLDVSSNSAFSSFVSGFQDLAVGNVLTRAVTGLNASTAYFYRVRASNTGGTSGSSNVISVTTAAPPNPIDQPDFFVKQHYLDFLNRTADASGLAFWTNEITVCGSNQTCIDAKRVNVSAAYFLSIEFQQTGYLVERIYKISYGSFSGASTLGGAHPLSVPIVRLTEFLPDTQKIGLGVVVGQTGWETVLENNKLAFTLEFVTRSRFTAATAFPLSMTPAAFVDKLFANAGFTPSSADRTAAINLFGSATTSADTTARSRALRLVAENATLAQQESNRAFVLMQYFGYLRRNPNDPDADYTGYDFWLGKLNQFNGNYANADMVKAFITSTEYRHRFGP